MDLKLNGKRALVTGASKGIGLAVARALAAEGCHLDIAARGVAALEQARDAHSPSRARHRRAHPRRRSVPGRGSGAAGAGLRRGRHPGEQCRLESGRRPRRHHRPGLAQLLGPQGVRLHQSVPLDPARDEGAPRRRDRQHHRLCGRAAQRPLHHRLDRQRRADGVQPLARQPGAGFRRAGGRGQSGLHRDRSGRKHAAQDRREQARLGRALARRRARARPAVRPHGQAGRGRRRGDVPGLAARVLRQRHGGDRGRRRGNRNG